MRPHGPQHTRLPCPSPSPTACSNLHPLGQWRHPTILSSAVPFSCLQSFPVSRSFPMSQFSSGGQSIGTSASPSSELPMNIQDWSSLGWTALISLQSQGLSRVFSNTIAQHINSTVPIHSSKSLIMIDNCMEVAIVSLSQHQGLV